MTTRVCMAHSSGISALSILSFPSCSVGSGAMEDPLYIRSSSLDGRIKHKHIFYLTLEFPRATPALVFLSIRTGVSTV
jgi:hypothetical protein